MKPFNFFGRSNKESQRWFDQTQETFDLLLMPIWELVTMGEVGLEQHIPQGCVLGRKADVSTGQGSRTG